MARSTLIGSLKISLLAVTKGYEKGLGRAASKTKKFSRLLRTNVTAALGMAAAKLTLFGLKGLGSIPGLVVTAVKALAKLVKILAITLVAAAGAAGVALALLARSALKDIDRLAKSSRIIGITVDELRAFELAASEAGVETKVLEKSLRNMTRQINDAAKGTGEAVDALRDLRLDAKKIAALSIPEQFMAIADALEAVSDRGERIQLAFDLFGGRGLSLLNLLTPAIRDAADELDRMGLNLSDLDSRKIELFNDSFADLKRAIKGVGEQIAIALAPIIGGLVVRMTTLIESLGGVSTIVGTVISRASVLTVSAFNKIGEAFEDVVKFMRDNSVTIAGVFSKIVGGAFSAAEFIVNAFGVMQGGLKLTWLAIKLDYLLVLGAMSNATLLMVQGVLGLLNFISGIDLKVPESLKVFTKTINSDLVKAGAQYVTKFKEVFFGNLDNSFTAMGLKIGMMGERAKKSIEDIGPVAEVIFTEMAAKLEAFGPLGEELSKLLTRLRTDFDDMGGAAKQAAEDFEEGFAGSEQSLNRLEGAAAQVAASIADVFHRGIEGATRSIARAMTRNEDAFRAFRDLAVSMLEDIIAAMLRIAAFRFLASVFPGSNFIAATTGIAARSAASSAPVSASFAPAFSQARAPARGGDVHINFFGPTSGNDEIRKQVGIGIAEAQPALTNAAVAAVLDRNQRNPRFLR